MDVYRTPDERFAGLPGYDFKPHYFEMYGMVDHGKSLRMHYLEEGPAHGDPVLLLHGEPTWSFLYRKMIRPLADAGYRVIAPDYFGFGRSDKPQSLEWYTYDRHVESIKRLVDELDLERITVVVQDWGGPIGLRVATEMDELFARLVILNTGILSGEAKMSDAWWAFHDFVDKVKPDVPVGMLIKGACLTEPAPEVLAGYEAPFPVPESKWGVSAFPQIVPTSTDAPGAAEQVEMAERLKAWKKPALVAFSDSDAIFSVKTGERFVERIPGAGPMITIPQAAHFLQEDQGEMIAAHIVEFLK
ncbi:MAG TPA: haloalkane dehalogenase, partial [Candidatus Dormibacteraeota bacterium]|nr:haloalkane dehalogenase [Candidatus Dormibacteraeota bacterium]